MDVGLHEEAPLTGAVSLITVILRKSHPGQRVLILAMLEWIAWAVRPLNVHEMFVALGTPLDIGVFPQSSSAGRLDTDTVEQLMSICAPLVEFRGNDLLCFRERGVKDLIRSSGCISLGFAPAEIAQERMAAVCLVHLRCAHTETILRPWVETGRLLRKESSGCRLRGYSTSFWQHHYRMAESSSVHLPAILHRTLDAAIDSGDDRPQFLSACSGRKSSVGLWICSLHDLEILGRTYLEMGADPEFPSDTGDTPLHVAAANSSAQMLRLLLNRGANPEPRNSEGFTPLHLAALLGHAEIVSLLLAKGASVKPDDYGGQPEKSFLPQWADYPPLYTYHYANALLELNKGTNMLAGFSGPRANRLHLVDELDKEAVVRCLIDSGFDFEACNFERGTTLMVAVNELLEANVSFPTDNSGLDTLTCTEDLDYLEPVLHQSGPTYSTLQHFRSLNHEEHDSSSPGRRPPRNQIGSPAPVKTPRAVSESPSSDVEDDWIIMESENAENWADNTAVFKGMVDPMTLNWDMDMLSLQPANLP